jgi:uncharacterized membrane protein YsdA (DUF1294 family)/cold shock CspA family protein
VAKLFWHWVAAIESAAARRAGIVSGRPIHKLTPKKMPPRATPSLTGTITSWDLQKGYGYLESGGKRHFLHIRDFAERRKTPEVGDVIHFALGADRKGRTCAAHAVHASDGGRVRPIHLGVVALLLVAPGFAAWRMAGQNGFWFVLGGYAGVSGLTYLIYAYDKRSARADEWRQQESTMHFFELIGGWPGAFLAQRRLRHKCSKRRYQFVFWLIVALHQFVAVDWSLEWRLTRAAVKAVSN